MFNTVIPSHPFATHVSLVTATLACTLVFSTASHAQQSFLPGKSPVSSAAQTTAAAVASAPVQASSCDTLRTQIENKIRAAGVSQVSLEIIDSAAAAGRRVVGSCGMGARKIVYAAAVPHPSTAVAPPPPLLPSEIQKPGTTASPSTAVSPSAATVTNAKPAAVVRPNPTPSRPLRESVAAAPVSAKGAAIWTECKDGSLTLGECKKK